MEIFHPVEDNANYKALMDKARKKVKRMDRIGKKAGFPTPVESPLDEALKVVISAVGAGIAKQDWDCVAEGLVMLQDVELLVRQKEMGVEPDKSRIYLR